MHLMLAFTVGEKIVKEPLDKDHHDIGGPAAGLFVAQGTGTLRGKPTAVLNPYEEVKWPRRRNSAYRVIRTTIALTGRRSLLHAAKTSTHRSS
jgi:hypothetical protein